MLPIVIQLTEEDAKQFVEFQKHRNLIKILSQVGFFGLTDARVEILIDKMGKTGDIFVHKKYSDLSHIAP